MIRVLFFVRFSVQCFHRTPLLRETRSLTCSSIFLKLKNSIYTHTTKQYKLRQAQWIIQVFIAKTLIYLPPLPHLLPLSTATREKPETQNGQLQGQHPRYRRTHKAWRRVRDGIESAIVSRSCRAWSLVVPRWTLFPCSMKP